MEYHFLNVQVFENIAEFYLFGTMILDKHFHFFDEEFPI